MAHPETPSQRFRGRVKRYKRTTGESVGSRRERRGQRTRTRKVSLEGQGDSQQQDDSASAQASDEGRGAVEDNAENYITRLTDTSQEQQSSQRSPSYCPDCGDRVYRKGGEFVCRGCGLIVSEQWTDHGPEWRKDSSSTLARCNGPTESVSSSPGVMQTQIGYAYERRVKANNGNTLSRAQHTFTRGIRYEQELLNHAVPELNRICAALELPDSVLNRSCYLFREAYECGFLSSRCVDTVTAALTYAVCRELDVPRLPVEFADVSRLTEDDAPADRRLKDHLLRTYRQLCQDEGVSVKPKPVRPQLFLSRFASTLSIPPVVRRTAQHVLDDAEQDGLASGRSPAGLAAGAIWLTLQEFEESSASVESARCQGPDDIRQCDLADVANTSPSSIRELASTLQPYLNKYITQNTTISDARRTGQWTA